MSSASCRMAARDGVGVGLLPQYTPEGAFGNSICAIVTPSRSVAPKMRVFVGFLVAAVANGLPPA